MADAFASSVSSATMALLCDSGEPDVLAHTAISSMAAARACWLYRSKVSASAVAILAAGLSDMSIALEWWCGKPRSSHRWLGLGGYCSRLSPLFAFDLTSSLGRLS